MKSTVAQRPIAMTKVRITAYQQAKGIRITVEKPTYDKPQGIVEYGPARRNASATNEISRTAYSTVSSRSAPRMRALGSLGTRVAIYIGK